MRFWDASAIVPLCLDQPATTRALAKHADDPELVVWWGTPIECASAIARLHRDGQLSSADEAQARSLLATLKASWFEVQPGDAVREQALRILRLHALRAADALQLAAALEWSGSPADGRFVTLDERLAAAAQREGFAIA
ncbi:MAG: PIN domain-containing protein [Gemmatimonadota bacterium]